MKNNKQNRFWNSFASKYDAFIARYAKDTYEKSLLLIKKEINTNSNVLEVGTGTGLIAFSIAEFANTITAIDYAPEMIRVANSKLEKQKHNNISFYVSEANMIKSEDKLFDIVIASNVFHLLTNADEALWEIRRVLKDRGKVILPTYCHGQNIKSRFISAIMGLSGFKAINRWSTAEFREFVCNEGFTIEKEEVIADKIPMSFLVASKKQ